MKTVVAETLFLGKEAFETIGEVTVVPDRKIGPEHLADADALVIRSKTRVTPELIAGSPLRFIGTATAGFEHLDVTALDATGIGWTAAPGCNADSVADYITAALLYAHTFKCMGMEGKTLGIVGAGQVGSRVAKRAEALGLRVLLNDPPRAAREGPDGFLPLETLLEKSDIVTLHVPLTADTPWPTRKMAGIGFFDRMRPGSLFINAARGPVLDNDALLEAKARGIPAHAILDVWDPEPNLRADVLAAATIGTPHIAGHSLEGKLNGTVQVYQKLCRFFGIQPTWNPAPLLPAPAVPKLEISVDGKTDLEVFSEAVFAVYDIRRDFLRLNDIAQFDALRANYPIRREFKNSVVSVNRDLKKWRSRFAGLGFAPCGAR